MAAAVGTAARTVAQGTALLQRSPGAQQGRQRPGQALTSRLRRLRMGATQAGTMARVPHFLVPSDEVPRSVQLPACVQLQLSVNGSSQHMDEEVRAWLRFPGG